MAKAEISVSRKHAVAELAEICARFGVAGVSTAEQLYGGYSGSNYKVTDGAGGLHVVKVRAHRSR